MIEEWNDDFKEEPKNFTSFTSIKLKSRPPKSPPDKKSGRIISNSIVKLKKTSLPESKPPSDLPNSRPQQRTRKSEPLPPKELPTKPDKVVPDIKKDESSSEIPSAPPPPPPPPPGPKKSKSKSGIPRPPPPPSSAPLSEKELRVKKAREKMVDRIKRAARSRPDWKSVMKDIEGGAKLRKVSSSDKLDRSNPILPKSRGKGGKFFYESEKPVVQNQLLGEIQRGVKLRHVKTNDRSKPDFAKLGLRKLRRQLTVEEKKSISSNTPDALPSSSDEEEDIDQMRDDLASTKTQLAEEIKKNKKLETEQKILQIDLQSLQAEVKKLKRKLKEAGVHEAKPLTNGEAEALAPKLSKSMSKLRMMEEDLDFSELDTIEKDIQLLNDQIEVQKKRAEIAEVKCDELNQKLQVSQTSCDEWEMRSVYFEKKYKTLQKDQGIELPEIDCSGTQTDPIEMGPAKSDSSTGLYTKKSGSRKSFASVSRMQSFKEEDESDDESSSSSEEDTLSDHQGDEDEDEERDSEEEDEDDLKGSCADMEKREEREFIMWKNRLSHMKDKVKNVRKERNNLRERVKKFFCDMRLERKEYLKLKAELKDLLDQMKEDEDVIEEEDEEEESEEEEEEIAQDEEAPDWWTDETPQKPKKLKKRKKKQKENEDEDENIVDMSGLEDPQWSDSDQEESESEEEDENTANRIKSLKERTKSLEENMNAKRKETYQLKSKIDQCEEMIAEEKRRHARLENELHMLLADI